MSTGSLKGLTSMLLKMVRHLAPASDLAPATNSGIVSSFPTMSEITTKTDKAIRGR
jgi:hypothetical protein